MAVARIRLKLFPIPSQLPVAQLKRTSLSFPVRSLRPQHRPSSGWGFPVVSQSRVSVSPARATMSALRYSSDAKFSSSAQTPDSQASLRIAYKHIPDERRFVALVMIPEDGSSEEGGHLEYQVEDNRIRLTHTLADPKYRGRGIAAELVRLGVVYAEENKLAVIPECTYISQKWLPRNKDKFPNLVVLEPSRL